MRKLNICTWKSCKAIKSNLGLSIAFALSAVWSFGAVLILLINFRYAEGTKTLDLNEIGDYLAGAFSPLAFFWLAYGYWMQNRELKSTTKIASNAERISQNQFKYLRIKDENLFQPIFEFEVKDHFQNGNFFQHLIIKFKTTGSTIFDVSLISEDLNRFYSTLSENDEKELTLTLDSKKIKNIDRKISEIMEGPFEEIPDKLSESVEVTRIKIKYIDRIGTQNKAESIVCYSHGKFQIAVRNAIKLQDYLDVN